MVTDASNGSYTISYHDMNKFDVGTAFPSGLIKACLDSFVIWLLSWGINSFQSNCKGKQNEWYFKYALSMGNVDHENKLH